MVKVHHMIVDVLRTYHQIADQLRVGRNLNLQRVFNCAHRGDPVHQRADAADALRQRPSFTRVATLQYQFDAAHHGAGG